jgi:uncharacterized membrane protein YfhO
MYFLLKRFGLTKPPSLVGSVIWMFAGYNTTWLPWLPITATLTWLPWSFYFVVGIFRCRKWSDTGLFGISILLTSLGGHIQFMYYSYLSVMFFILWLFLTSSLPWKNRFHPLALSLVGFALGIFSSSVQLISTLELAELSIRGAKPIQELMYVNSGIKSHQNRGIKCPLFRE